MRDRAAAEAQGRRAERIAAWWLRLKGWRIIARRVRTPAGEIDLIALAEEEYDFTQPLTIFDPQDTWKKMTLTGYTARKLLEPLYTGGVPAGPSPALPEIQAWRRQDEGSIWEQHLRLVNPSAFKVDLSDRLWALRHGMLHAGEGEDRA